MRKKLQLVATFGALALSLQGYSQRYLTEVFDSAHVTSNVIYGTNISVLTGSPMASDIGMDIYQPAGTDTAAKRPLVVVLHTGSFLPAIANGQPTGSKTDSAVVEMCKRFAKKGYVAVAADYRLGWNPISGSQDVRTGTLLQAVYRAIQDAKNCVRYFKNDAATANTYKVDTNRIAVGGLGSGGYIALAYASLNKPAELQITKFLDNSQSPPVPYVVQSVYGNFDGTDSTMLNLPNYANHSSKIQMVFNVGGAIGDLSWIEAGEVPVVSLQCTNDPNAPYTTGTVIVPTTGDPVVEASGSYDVITLVDSINNNAIFENSLFNDAYTTHANMLNDGMEGLYPFVTPAPGTSTCIDNTTETEQGSPWDWWDANTFIAMYNAYSSTTNGTVVNCHQMLSNPDMSATKGRHYIDTIQGYVAPRMVCALSLPGCTPNPSGVKENASANSLNIFPNPATSTITVAAKGNTIQTVELYDLTGRMVKQVSGLNVQEYTIQRENLTSGLYFTKVKLNKGGVVTKRIVIE